MTILEAHRISWLLGKASAIRRDKKTLEIDFTDEALARDLQDLFWRVKAQEFSLRNNDKIH